MRAIIGVVIFLLMSSAAAEAQEKPTRPTSVQALLDLCQAKEKTEAYYTCFTYVAAVTDYSLAIKENFWTGICSKSEINYKASIQAFVNWAKKHPEKWADERIFGVVEALREAWPCKGGAKKK